MKPLGLYAHVPFCARKCAYCDFPSYEGQMALRQPYVDKLCQEIIRRGAEAGHPEADSVYIGGGTPSLLMPAQISAILNALRDSFTLSPDCEISCEANPGMLTERFLAALVLGGVNRLSLGAQASEDGQLRILGRQHGWPQVMAAVKAAKAAGIHNINVDLMLGIPRQTLDIWLQTLDKALALDVQHLSCYGLIVEEGTPLAADIDACRLRLPDEGLERDMYELTLDRLAKAGFEQYEISNFAQPGFACRHNLGTWQRADYMGFGSAAHSLEGGDTRLANPLLIEDYLNDQPPERTQLDQDERIFESLMLGLRMTEGIDPAAFEAMHGLSFEAACGQQARASLAQGLSEYGPQGHFRLTRRGMDVMNSILLDFMPVK